jgi:chromosome segregation ATPase
MDTNRIERMIEWLDEERRRDKTKIAKLEERIAQQQEYIETMTRRMNGLEGDQVSLKSAFLPAGRDADLMEQMRVELQQAIETMETKRTSADRESDRRAEVNREAVLRPVREIGERIEKLERAQDDLAVARVERDRFANILAAVQQRVEDMSKKLEEPERRIAFLEEQRRQDARRISETQTELPEIQKQVDGLRPKMDLIESLALRNEKLILEVQSGEKERREAIQQFVEQQTLYTQQRENRIEELSRTFTQYGEELRRGMERMETWAETYRAMKKILEDFERMSERLDRRINEVAEMQRLSEERFRQEWSSWSADDQKRWKQFTLTNDEQWRSHDREFQQFVARFNEAVQAFAPIQENIDRLWKLQRAQAEMMRESFHSLLGEYEPEKPRLVPTNGSIRTTQQ